MAAHLLPNPDTVRISPIIVVTSFGIESNFSIYGCSRLLRVSKLKPIV